MPYANTNKVDLNLDGNTISSASSSISKIRDLTRQNALEAAGFKLIRFRAKDVGINIDGVLSSIMTECGKELLTEYPAVSAYKTSP